MFTHRTVHFLLIVAIWSLWSFAVAETTAALPASVARILAGYKVPSADFSAYVHEIGQPDPLLAFNEAVRDGRIKRGQKVIMEGFGGGFTWGSVLLIY